jgi:hypothetical protein
MGFVPATVFPGFGTLFTDGFAGCWEFPVTTGFVAASDFGLFGTGAWAAELIGV